MRLIDSDVLYGVESLLNTDIVQNSQEASWLMAQVLHDIQASPAIDPETLPIVRQLREELVRVTAERDALLNQGIWTTSKYDGNTLTTVSVGYSETGKGGPYKLVMNVDEFGVLTMAKEVARALFGHTESKEATP